LSKQLFLILTSLGADGKCEMLFASGVGQIIRTHLSNLVLIIKKKGFTNNNSFHVKNK